MGMEDQHVGENSHRQWAVLRGGRNQSGFGLLHCVKLGLVGSYLAHDAGQPEQDECCSFLLEVMTEPILPPCPAVLGSLCGVQEMSRCHPACPMSGVCCSLCAPGVSLGWGQLCVGNISFDSRSETLGLRPGLCRGGRVAAVMVLVDHWPSESSWEDGETPWRPAPAS